MESNGKQDPGQSWPKTCNFVLAPARRQVSPQVERITNNLRAAGLISRLLEGCILAGIWGWEIFHLLSPAWLLNSPRAKHRVQNCSKDAADLLSAVFDEIAVCSGLCVKISRLVGCLEMNSDYHVSSDIQDPLYSCVFLSVFAWLYCNYPPADLGIS